MVFRILNETGSVVTIGGTSYTNNSWVDVMPYWAFGSLTATQNDIDGSNAGRNTVDGTMIRDKVAEKEKVNFVSKAILHSDAMAIKNLTRPQTFRISTDYFSGTIQTYTMYANNRAVTHVRHNSGGTEYVTISFPMVEV